MAVSKLEIHSQQGGASHPNRAGLDSSGVPAVNRIRWADSIVGIDRHRLPGGEPRPAWPLSEELCLPACAVLLNDWAAPLFDCANLALSKITERVVRAPMAQSQSADNARAGQ